MGEHSVHLIFTDVQLDAAAAELLPSIYPLTYPIKYPEAWHQTSLSDSETSIHRNSSSLYHHLCSAFKFHESMCFYNVLHPERLDWHLHPAFLDGFRDVI